MATLNGFIGGIAPADLRINRMTLSPRDDAFGAVHLVVANLDLYLTTDAATSLRDRLTAILAEEDARHVVVDSDTGETLTPPLPHADATALVAATTGRNVRVQAVTA